MESTTAMDNLVRWGERHGGLKISDLALFLPVDDLTVEQITEIVARLEEAGIPVEIDAELESPISPMTGSNHQKAVPKLAPARDLETTEDARIKLLAFSIEAMKARQPRAPQAQGILKSGTVFVIVAAGILVVLGLVAWGISGVGR